TRRRPDPDRPHRHGCCGPIPAQGRPAHHRHRPDRTGAVAGCPHDLPASNPLAVAEPRLGRATACKAEIMTQDFYSEMTTRNIGFISEAEQARLKGGAVFVAGVGGMGGAAVQMLVRAGVGKIAIADLDTFEVSNLNRQLFAFTDTVDRL